MYRLYAEDIKFYGQWSVWIYWRKKYGSWQHGYHKDDERYAEYAAKSGSKEEKERQKRRARVYIKRYSSTTSDQGDAGWICYWTGLCEESYVCCCIQSL